MCSKVTTRAAEPPALEQQAGQGEVPEVVRAELELEAVARRPARRHRHARRCSRAGRSGRRAPGRRCGRSRGWQVERAHARPRAATWPGSPRRRPRRLSRCAAITPGAVTASSSAVTRPSPLFAPVTIAAPRGLVGDVVGGPLVVHGNVVALDIGPSGAIASAAPVTTLSRPTMRDVAQRAGVSLKTVSRVINEEAGVTPGDRREGHRGDRRARLRAQRPRALAAPGPLLRRRSASSSRTSPTRSTRRSPRPSRPPRATAASCSSPPPRARTPSASASWSARCCAAASTRC